MSSERHMITSVRHPDSRARLHSIVDASYITMPYFQPDDVDRLKCTAVSGHSKLEETIRALDDAVGVMPGGSLEGLAKKSHGGPKKKKKGEC